MRSYPPPAVADVLPAARDWATASTGVRSRTVIRIRSGQDLLTCADRTCVMASTRRAAAAVFTRISGSPSGIAAAARTWLAGTRCVPLTTTDRTTSTSAPARRS